MLEKIKIKYELVREADSQNDTTKSFRVKNYIGKIGFITSMTDHFCGSCNRLRLTADGNLKVCLFSNKEVSLRDLIRRNESEENIYKIIMESLGNKKFSHDGMYKIAENKNRPMITIGG